MDQNTKRAYFDDLRITSLDEVLRSPSHIKNWNKLICKSADIYYTLEYLSATQINEDGNIFLAQYTHGNSVIIYPFVLRAIPLSLKTKTPANPLFDIRTPYEFGGPLYFGPRSDRKIVQNNFITQFGRYCRKADIVSEFVRFNPPAKNHVGWENWYDISVSCANVVIELTHSEDKILAAFRRDHRRDTLLAQTHDINIEREIVTQNSFLKFRDIYINSMDQLGADSYYYFSDDYFTQLSNLGKERVSLYVMKDINDNYIGGATFLHSGDYSHYHLSAMGQKFREKRASSLLFYQAALDFKKMNSTILHLGGAAKSQTGLLHFKEGFSKSRLDYFIGRRIHNETNYNLLCDMKFVSSQKLAEKSYFPAYRG